MKHYYQIQKMIDEGVNKSDIPALIGATVTEVEQVVANIHLEGKMRGDAFKAYTERQEQLKARGHHIDTDASMKKVREMLKPTAMAIQLAMMEGNKGRPHIAIKRLHREDPFMLALTTIRIIIMGCTKGKTALTAMSSRVAHSVAPELTEDEMFRVGLWLIRFVCNNSDGHFEIYKEKGQNGKGSYQVRTTDEFLEWEEKNIKMMGELAVNTRPMVVPPKPWTGLQVGGYYHEKMQAPFIRNLPSATHRTHGPRAIPMVYDAVNMIQATPFAINELVLNTAVKLRDDGGVFFKSFFEHIPTLEQFADGVEITLSDKEREKEINRLEDQLGFTKQAKAMRGREYGHWAKRTLNRIKEGHSKFHIKERLLKLRYERHITIQYSKLKNSRRSKNRVIETALTLAEEYVNHKAIYFPHNLDWRGRVYPLTSGLTTQGTTIQKGLLKFATGKPLNASGRGEDALDWLKVHTANSYGKDKASWQDRILWTEENTELITRVAQDPIGNLDDWCHTDEPWLFLAACEQMVKVYEHGLDSVVDIPIPMDGTCNGAQHYAAMTRDTQGAFGVNVAPNGTEGLQERLTSIRAKLGNPKVTQGEQRITSGFNQEIKKVVGL